MKIIAMIPARLGSQRVPMKNLRLIDGKPLIQYSIDAAKSAGCFDEIYINSEAEIFSEIATDAAILFYKRPENLASNTTINDEFTFDFMKSIKGDLLIQILPTSPLITPEEIRSFVIEMKEGNWDTLVSTIEHQIACVFDMNPINFSKLEPHVSSQDMKPVSSYATVLMGWKYTHYLQSMKTYGFAYHGSNGRTGYFKLSGLTSIDIDNEEDFELAEVAINLRNKKNKGNIKIPEYYKKN
jgi:CMP-N-acetylneuraminic acid synthetase